MNSLLGFAQRHYVAVIVLVVALGGTSYAAINAAKSNQIKACAERGDGSLRMVGEKSDCGKKERFVSWNKRGKRGPQGPVGPAGAPGVDATLEPWHQVGLPGEPQFHDGWFHSDGGGVGRVAFRKSSQGQVFLTGWLETLGLWNAVGPAFTLPEGYRPAQLTWVPIVGLQQGEQKFVVIDTDGTVKPSGNNGHGFAVLDGVSFFTDAP